VTRSSRAGSFYDSQIEPVFHTSIGELTPTEFKAKLEALNPETRFDTVKKGTPSCMRFSRKSCACGDKIKLLPDGRAVCRGCNTVFNDGGSTTDENGNSLLIVTNRYSDGRITEAPPPRKRTKSDMHRIMRAVV
jgi:hypothetical protein